MTFLTTQNINSVKSDFSRFSYGSEIKTNFVAAIYVRVSTKPQADPNKVSLQIQERQAKEYAEKQGWEIYNVYTDKVSGYLSYENRPGGEVLLQDARKGLFNLVLLWDSDRNGRDPEALAAKLFRHDMRVLGIQVTSLENPIMLVDPVEYRLEPYNEGQILTESVQDLVSAANVSKFRRKSMEAKLEKARQGKMLTPPPYGYKLEYTKDKSGKIMFGKDKRIIVKRVVNENERPIVLRIYDEYVYKGLSMCEIRDGLNKDGIQTMKGRHWELALVSRILKNPVYFGQVVYNKHYRRKNALDKTSRWGTNPEKKWVIVEPENTEHEAIISRAIFDKAQEIRIAKLKVGAVASYNDYLFSGIMKCGICGHVMYSKKSPNEYKRKTDGKMVKSVCAGYACGRWSRFKDTEKNYVGENKILELLLGDLSKFKNNPEVLKGFLKAKEEAQVDDNKEKLNAAEKRLDKLSARSKRLIGLYGDKNISKKEFDEVKEECNSDIKKTSEYIGSLKRIMEDKEQNKERKINFKSAVTKFEKIFKNNDPRLKKMFIRSLIDSIVIKRREIKINYSL